MPTKLFDDINTTDGEEEFISNVLKDDKLPTTANIHQQKAQTLAIFRLAKEIENSTISNDKSSRAMLFLTLALVFVGVGQILVAFLK